MTLKRSIFCQADTPFWLKIMGRKIKHGKSGTPEYWAWANSKARCNDKEHKYYKHYGGRGIKHKLESVTDLLNAIGRRPTPRHTLDRIDNDGNYEKGNIRWATREEQARNKRSNIIYKGECAVDASKRLGGERHLVSNRIRRRGWSVKKAFIIKNKGRQKIKQTIKWLY